MTREKALGSPILNRVQREGEIPLGEYQGAIQVRDPAIPIDTASLCHQHGQASVDASLAWERKVL